MSNEAVRKVSESYLEAWKSKDIDGILRFLHPEIAFRSPNASTKGRDAYAAGARRFLAMFDSVDTRAMFVSGDRAMFALDFHCIQPIGLCPTAELIALRDGLIVDDQLFFDARPFEALMRAKAAAGSGKQ